MPLTNKTHHTTPQIKTHNQTAAVISATLGKNRGTTAVTSATTPDAISLPLNPTPLIIICCVGILCRFSSTRCQLRATVLILKRPSLRSEQQPNSRHHRDPTVHRPSNLASHDTAGEDVDALEEPNAANDDQEYGNDSDDCSHVEVSCSGSTKQFTDHPTTVGLDAG